MLLTICAVLSDISNFCIAYILYHNLSVEDATELALNRPIWRLLAASRAMHWNGDDDDDDDDTVYCLLKKMHFLPVYWQIMNVHFYGNYWCGVHVGGIKALVVTCFQFCLYSTSYKLARWLFGLLIQDRASVLRYRLCDVISDVSVLCDNIVCTVVAWFLLYSILAFDINNSKSGCVYSAFNN